MEVTRLARPLKGGSSVFYNSTSKLTLSWHEYLTCNAFVNFVVPL